MDELTKVASGLRETRTWDIPRHDAPELGSCLPALTSVPLTRMTAMTHDSLVKSCRPGSVTDPAPTFAGQLFRRKSIEKLRPIG